MFFLLQNEVCYTRY